MSFCSGTDRGASNPVSVLARSLVVSRSRSATVLFGSELAVAKRT